MCAGNVRLSPGQFVALKKKRKALFKFLKSNSTNSKKVLVQKGGFLPIILSVLTPILTSLAEKAIQAVIEQ